MSDIDQMADMLDVRSPLGVPAGDTLPTTISTTMATAIDVRLRLPGGTTVDEISAKLILADSSLTAENLAEAIHIYLDRKGLKPDSRGHYSYN